MSARSYDQLCGLARALDVLGERWALLIVRELLLGPKRYGDLAAALPGIGTNILASRLASLAEAGVVRRTKLPPPANVPVYELTERGEGLRPALRALALWGLPLIPEDPTSVNARASWAALTMSALMDEAGAPDDLASVAFVVGDERFHLVIADGGSRVREGSPAVAPDLTITADLMTFLGVASGRRSAADALADGALVADGEPALVERLFEVFRLPAPTS
jgi:DNA-binding HxlR family transcriptional regulator/putative sterol carrier protein